MMIEYITKTDKNGKTLYYRVTDGKKKNIKRSEYEANCDRGNQLALCKETVAVAPEIPVTEDLPLAEYDDVRCDTYSDDSSEYKSEPIPPHNSEIQTNDTDESKDNHLSLIKLDSVETSVINLVKAIVESSYSENFKLSLQYTKNYALIKFKNRLVIALRYNANREVTGITFMGTTVDTRKRTTKLQFNGLDDVSNCREKIIEQVCFINEWLTARNRKDA